MELLHATFKGEKASLDYCQAYIHQQSQWQLGLKFSSEQETKQGKQETQKLMPDLFRSRWVCGDCVQGNRMRTRETMSCPPLVHRNKQQMTTIYSSS